MKHGRIAMSEQDLDVIRKCVRGKASYVEIGVLWGGSLIEAALAEPGLLCWGIDPFIGYYGGADIYAGGNTPTIEAVRDNLTDAGVSDRVALVKSKSHPFPVKGIKFDVGLIDGDHSEEAVRQDWQNMKRRCQVVLFHDIDDPAIERVLESITTWKVERIGRMAKVSRD